MIQSIKNAKVNTGRQIEMDIAKGFAVFCMIAVHVLSSLARQEEAHTLYGGIIEFLGTLPAAPVFMFTLGAGIVYSRNARFETIFKRGCRVFALGYLLNFARTLILFAPLILNGTWQQKIPYLMEGLFNIDILQFAGLALIYVGLIHTKQLKNRQILMLTLIISCANLVLINFQTDNIFLSALTGLLWGSSPYAAFPFATWHFYPVAGYIFANLLIRQTHKTDFYKLVLRADASVVAALSLLIYVFKLDSGLMTEVAYYHHTLFNNVLYTAFVLTWIALCYFIAKYLPTVVLETFKRWSQQVNKIYCIHWLLISTACVLVGYQKLGAGLYWLFLICIIWLSDNSELKLKSKNGKV